MSTLYLVRFRGLYIAYVLDEHGLLLANTIPLESKNEVFKHVKRFKYSRVVEGSDPLSLAEPLYKAYMGDDSDAVKYRDVANRRLLSEKCSKVLELCAKVPRGYVTTYGAIAKALRTSPRAVGVCLAKNPWPLIYPCHRVVGFDGRLVGYEYGIEIKRSILEREGVEFEDSRVSKRRIIRDLNLLNNSLN